MKRVKAGSDLGSKRAGAGTNNCLVVQRAVSGSRSPAMSGSRSPQTAIQHLLESGVVRTPLLLFALALAVRAVLVALFPDPAYPDSYYYVDVARSIAAGNGLNVDFIWIFAEVGNK